MPVSARHRGPAQPVRIVFDHALQVNPALDLLNWSLRIVDNRWTPIAASTSGDTVSLTLGGFPMPDPGPDVASYSPPLFDVIATNGLPAAAFIDFPVSGP